MKNLLKPENYGQIKFVDEKLGSLEFIAFFMKDVYFWNSVSEITCSRMIHCTTNYYGSLNFEENTTTTKVVCFLVLYPICHIFHARKFLIFCILTISFAKWFLTIYWNTVIFLANIIIKSFENKLVTKSCCSLHISSFFAERNYSWCFKNECDFTFFMKFCKSLFNFPLIISGMQWWIGNVLGLQLWLTDFTRVQNWENLKRCLHN